MGIVKRHFGIYEQWKHHIGSYDIDGKTITSERLMKWAENPARKFICIFCGTEVTEDIGGYLRCHYCREYKGICPDC